ncbi:MAG: phage holin family protein [Proteobacteria bacterium]|nr:phage holin family protein [Pseudomonadota bacterium]
MAEESGPERDPETPGDRDDLLGAFRNVGAMGRSGVSAAKHAGEALRALVAADIALARSALGRALAFTAVAIVFGVSAWLLLMAALVAVLGAALQWSWPLALSVVALANVAVTAWAGWRAIGYFEHTRMKATRRQLARLGIGDGDADGEERADAGEASRT